MKLRHRLWQGDANDAAELARIHAPIFPDAWPQDAFASLLARDEVFVLIGARCDVEGAEGFILVRSVDNEGEILTLGVMTPTRRTGLGKALLAAACKEAFARGAREVFLEVGENNEAALALYQRAGFAVVGRRAAYYRHGPEAADAIVMRKALDSAATAGSST